MMNLRETKGSWLTDMIFNVFCCGVLNIYHVVTKPEALTEVNMKTSVFLKRHLKMEAENYSETLFSV
jgi:hypothetical protein